jgi:hypothetical protein
LTGFGRILDDLNGAGVRYVVVGGIAVIRHGVVRATRDVDPKVALQEIERSICRRGTASSTFCRRLPLR